MLGSITVRLVGCCARHPRVVVLLAMVVTLASLALTATSLGINTSTSEMISADVPFRQREIDFDRAFPQDDDLLVIVVDATTPAVAEASAAALAARLGERNDEFRSVRRPDAHAYFRTHGLLFLETAQVADIADRLIAAQPLLGTLAADPSLRGLLDVLDLALEGVARGEVALSDVLSEFSPVASTIEAVLSGQTRPLDWSRTFGDTPSDPRGNRRLILAQPMLDYGSLAPGAQASATVRRIAAELGLTGDQGISVRLTGSVALDDEELASVARGAEWGLALSFVLVLLLLAMAVRTVRLVAAIFVTLVVGLIVTTAFAALTVGTLNLISVAFGIMFVGIAVDFGIQFGTRYRGGGGGEADIVQALTRAGGGIGGAMVLAGATTSVGFLAFLPTRFDGVAELGLISGAGMIIAMVLNLTLLPALIAISQPPTRVAARGGKAWGAGLDAAMAVYHRWILAGLVVVGLIALAALPALRFDVNPLHLKDARSESVATLADLLADPLGSPYVLNVLTPGPAEAALMASRARALPEVGRTITVADLIPPDQEDKLAILADAAMILGPTLSPAATDPPPTPEDVIGVMTRVAEVLLALPEGGGDADLRRLANALDAAVDRGPGIVPALEAALIGGLPALLDDVRGLLALGPVSIATLPPDLAIDWRATDGRARVAIFPGAADLDNKALAAFTAAVRTVAPEATGMPASIVDSGVVVIEAFVTATVTALGAIVVLLIVALRRVTDVALVLAPLVLAGLLTLAGSVALGLPINFANIIGLPLLLGIGVSFPTYLVIGWRNGAEGVLQTGTARAVLFSAATTGAAFGALALSSHPGTAAMGALLLLAILALLVCNMIGLPVLLAAVRR